jgi:hypothetical protein
MFLDGEWMQIDRSRVRGRLIISWVMKIGLDDLPSRAANRYKTLSMEELLFNTCIRLVC